MAKTKKSAVKKSKVTVQSIMDVIAGRLAKDKKLNETVNITRTGNKLTIVGKPAKKKKRKK